MEFKGTKAPWATRKSFESPFLVKDEENNREWFSNQISIYDPINNGRVICDVNFMTDVKGMGWGHNETTEKWKANALLISKAPEMLEMLKKVVNEHETDTKSWSTILEIKDLIKSATEI